MSTPLQEEETLINQIGQPIHSTLPMNKAKFRDIVQKFVDCLDVRFDAIEDTIISGNYEELAELGHWLKGASGNCGLAQIAAAGLTLEEAARDADQNMGLRALRELREMKARIEIPEADLQTSGL
jgi:HPt (histidine-containing phosphotransfer) domain-containing protein